MFFIRFNDHANYNYLDNQCTEYNLNANVKLYRFLIRKVNLLFTSEIVIDLNSV